MQYTRPELSLTINLNVRCDRRANNKVQKQVQTQSLCWPGKGGAGATAQHQAAVGKEQHKAERAEVMIRKTTRKKGQRRIESAKGNQSQDKYWSVINESERTIRERVGQRERLKLWLIADSVIEWGMNMDVSDWQNGAVEKCKQKLSTEVKHPSIHFRIR